MYQNSSTNNPETMKLEKAKNPKQKRTRYQKNFDYQNIHSKNDVRENGWSRKLIKPKIKPFSEECRILNHEHWVTLELSAIITIGL